MLVELAAGSGPPALLVRTAPAWAGAGAAPATPRRPGGGGAPEALDAWMLLLAGFLGAPFAWSSLQGGALIGDVLPVAGCEGEQTGSGSVELLAHVEDAWHPRRCDHLLLGCVRNPRGVATTLVPAAALGGPGGLGDAVLAVLAEPRFAIGIDPAHLRGMSAVPTAVGPVAALTLDGHGRARTLRVDRAFTGTVGVDADADRALALLGERMTATAVPVVLGAGDVLLVDNRRCAHGRGSIPPADADRDRRWLRRVMTAAAPRPRVVDPLAHPDGRGTAVAGGAR
jgi:hypothetical protein